jgi:hypothetical protein
VCPEPPLPSQPLVEATRMPELNAGRHVQWISRDFGARPQVILWFDPDRRGAWDILGFFGL